MKPAPDRGRLLFLATAAAIILERLAIAAVVLLGPQFTWTSFLMPVTHIAVVVFLIFTADTLIYWLVLLWGVVTAGTFASNLWGEYQKAVAKSHPSFGEFLSAPQADLILGLAAFHVVAVLLLLTPAVRRYLAARRQILDQFEDVPPPPAATPTAG